jgi:hypothetical protein
VKFSQIDNNINHFFVLADVGSAAGWFGSGGPGDGGSSTHTSGQKLAKKIKGIASQGFQSATRQQGMPPAPLRKIESCPKITVWICVCVS